MIPHSLGKYTILRLLGRGGMAEVYLAHHPDLDRPVAIKVIHPQLSDAAFQERFHHEARLSASLRHPNIVQVYDFDVIDNQPFMVMEYLEGGTLKERLKQLRAQGGKGVHGDKGDQLNAPTSMPVHEIARLLEPIASALDYAHPKGIVHCDIKPTNILFTSQGEPVLTDFGIAKILSRNASVKRLPESLPERDVSVKRLPESLVGAPESLVGTPAYMSPEQVESRAVDARSDIYSLGAVLYEMATGREPFQSESPTELLRQQLQDAPLAPREINPTLPERVQVAILKALAKNPAERFASAGELASAFEAALHDTETTEHPVSIEDQPTLVESPRPSSLQHEAVVQTSTPSQSGWAFEKAKSGRGARRWLVPIIVFAGLILVALGFFIFGGGWQRSAAPAEGTLTKAALRFRNGTAQSDQVTLTIPGSLTATPNTQYEVWLLGDDSEKRKSLGILQMGPETANFVFTSPEGRNLVAEFDALEITAEPSPDSNPMPTGIVWLRGKLPPQALIHIRHLLVARPDTPKNVGFAVGLLQETQRLETTAGELLTATTNQDLKKVKQKAETLVNLIEGRAGKNYGDLDGDRTVADVGDGFGLLPNGDKLGYAQGTLEHARLAADQPDATANIKLHSGHTQIMAKNVGDWSASLRDLSLQIIRAENIQSAEAPVRQAVALARQILNGQDINGNEQVEPIPGEGGALLAYQHAQFMADIALTAP